MLCDNQFCLATMTLYFSAVWTQSGESGNTLKIKCSVTADERANIFPCLQRPKPSAVANVRWATKCLTLTKQASAKTTEWRGSPRLWLTPPQKKKPRRYLRGNALGIEAFRSRQQARLTIARRRSCKALNRIRCIAHRPVKMDWGQDAISQKTEWQCNNRIGN